MTNNYLSIDWGGTHLKGAIIANRKVIKEFELSAGNIKLLKNEDLINICSNILSQIEPTKLTETKLLIGAAGISDEKTAKRLKEAFFKITNYNQEIEVYPDFLCNHAASLNGKDGILSINGTGSIIFGVKGEKNIRLGGWGYIFDETPSGAFFGKKYLEAVLFGLEGNTSLSYYVDDYKSNYDFQGREDILNQIYFATSVQNYLGNYAKNLTTAYEKKEPYATEIINNSIVALCSQIKKMSDLLGLEQVNFCGVGGLWEKWKIFKELVESFCAPKGIKLIFCNNSQALYLGPFLYYSRITKMTNK